MDRLRRVAVLVSVVTPRYLKSEWTLRELTEFFKAAEEQGGLKVRDKARVFKVLKQPVPLEKTPPELRAILGYEFFKTDPETGKVRELDEVFGPDAQRDFWIRLDDLAHDLCALLEALEENAQLAPFVPDQPSIGRVATRLAWASGWDRTGRRCRNNANLSRAPRCGDASRSPVADRPSPAPPSAQPRCLSREGDRLPGGKHQRRARTTRGAAPRSAAARFPRPARPTDSARQRRGVPVILQDLAQSRMAIHLLGRNYGLVPEGATQLDRRAAVRAGHRARGPGPLLAAAVDSAGLQVDDARQRALLERVRARSADRQTTPTCSKHRSRTSRTAVQEWLTRDLAPAPAAGCGRPSLGLRRRCLPDRRSARRRRGSRRGPIRCSSGISKSSSRCSTATRRRFANITRRTCAPATACLIFYGAGNELWLRRKLREMQKSAGYGRTKPAPLVWRCLIAPHTPEKERFRTHEAIVVPQWDGVALDSLRPFVALSVKAGRPCLIRFPACGPSSRTKTISSSAARQEIDELLRRLRTTRFLRSSARRAAASRRWCARA